METLYAVMKNFQDKNLHGKSKHIVTSILCSKDRKMCICNYINTVGLRSELVKVVASISECVGQDEVEERLVIYAIILF